MLMCLKFPCKSGEEMQGLKHCVQEADISTCCINGTDGLLFIGSRAAMTLPSPASFAG